ncbi:hypothetical protein GGS21DRAFT_498731 [Xylaria nigripes]|nr:hypothetical protein GGS21DRAFT_498731 [Xylaria nigripes]
MLRGAAAPSEFEAETDARFPGWQQAKRLTSDLTEKSKSSNYQRHQRQQSASCLSNKRPHTPSLPSSRDHSRNHSPSMGLTGDGRGRNPSTRLTGQPSRPLTPSAESGTTSTPQLARTPVEGTPKTTTTTTTQSRFGFLTTAFTSRVTSPSQVPARSDEDLCDLDIEAALSPLPPPLAGEALSPAAYKNLQMNASTLLHRMQDAYRQQTAHIQEMRAEHEAQREEVEEMKLRTLSFKSQLEKMAATAAQQQEAMEQLVAELQAERRSRHEERLSREKVLRAAAAAAEAEDVSEDLGVDEEEEKKKRWRASNSTVKSELSSVDTDGDSAESESIFSRSRSPTAMTCVTENEAVDVPISAAALRLRVAPVPKPMPKPQLTAFQRLVKGMSASREDGCRNCGGQNASVAWNTISLLRDENTALKQRVAHLEVAVEGALDVVNGINI